LNDGYLYTADPCGPRRWPSRLMLSDGTVTEPVYEAHFSTGYIPLFAFDVSRGQAYTGLLFGVDESGKYRYEIDRAVYSGTSDWTQSLGFGERKPSTSWQNLYGSVIGRDFLTAYGEWRGGVWQTEPFYTGSQNAIGAESSYILWARYYAPSAVTVRWDGSVTCAWGVNSFSDQLYYREDGPLYLWSMGCEADVLALVSAGEVTPALLQAAAVSVEAGFEHVPLPAGANEFVYMTYWHYVDARAWHVTLPDALVDLGSRTFSAVNGVK